MGDVDLPIATDGDAGGPSPRPPAPPRAFLQVLAARLHARAALRLPGRARVLRPELPACRSAAERLAAVARRRRTETCARSQHAVARLRCAAELAALRRDARPAGATVRRV